MRCEPRRAVSIMLERASSGFRCRRADASRSSATDGAGLGLSLLKWIVDQHGATINLESCPGWGTSFTVKLPIDTSRTASRYVTVH